MVTTEQIMCWMQYGIHQYRIWSVRKLQNRHEVYASALTRTHVPNDRDRQSGLSIKYLRSTSCQILPVYNPNTVFIAQLILRWSRLRNFKFHRHIFRKATSLMSHKYYWNTLEPWITQNADVTAVRLVKVQNVTRVFPKHREVTACKLSRPIAVKGRFI